MFIKIIKVISQLFSPYNSKLLLIFLISFSTLCIAVEPELIQKGAAAKKESKLTESKQFDAWHLKCIAGDKGKDICLIAQSITGKRGKSNLLYLTVNYPDNQQGNNDVAVMRLYLPLGIYLVPGIIYNVDGGEKSKLPVRVCTIEGCRTSIVLNKKNIAALIKGKQLTVAFKTANSSQKIKVNASLIGFRKAFAVLRSKRKSLK